MEPALKLALVSCGLFFLTGLLTGLWKYVCIAAATMRKRQSTWTYVTALH